MKKELDRTTGLIIAGEIDVHKTLGPGLLESAYEACLAYELVERGMAIERQKLLPVTYRGVHVDCGYRLDLLVDKTVVVELKAVDSVMPIHKAHLLSYLKLSGCKVGLLINFNVRLLKDGIDRIVNNLPE